MFAINEDNSIYITRGDAASIDVTATAPDGTPYKFKIGDVVQLKVFKRKNCTKVVLVKEVVVEEESDTVTLVLRKNETKFDDFINKPTNYWYEVVLNPDTVPQTIIGYDEDGEKVLRLFPEGGDLNE